MPPALAALLAALLESGNRTVRSQQLPRARSMASATAPSFSLNARPAQLVLRPPAPRPHTPGGEAPRHVLPEQPPLRRRAFAVAHHCAGRPRGQGLRDGQPDGAGTWLFAAPGSSTREPPLMRLNASTPLWRAAELGPSTEPRALRLQTKPVLACGFLAGARLDRSSAAADRRESRVEKTPPDHGFGRKEGPSPGPLLVSAKLRAALNSALSRGSDTASAHAAGEERVRTQRKGPRAVTIRLRAGRGAAGRCSWSTSTGCASTPRAR